MPRVTRIIRRRYHRQLRRQRGGRARWRLLGVLLLVGFLTGAGLLLGGLLGVTAVYAAATQDLPDYNTLSRPDPTSSAATQIYAWTDASRETAVVIDELRDPRNGDRSWVPLDQLPTAVVDAAVAGTDPDFWRGRPDSPWQIGRAFLNFLVTGGAAPDPFPVAQQTMRRQLLSDPADSHGPLTLVDVGQKGRELLLVHRAASAYTPAQMLAWHLNTRYYGHLAFGVEAAAQVYFGKTAVDLTLAEASLLAAIPPDGAVNPIDTPEAARQVQAAVLSAMVEAGDITPPAAAAARSAPLNTAAGRGKLDVVAPLFSRYVRQELSRRFDPETLLRGGLQVYTSLDLSLQQQAACVARAHVNRLSGRIGPPLPADEQAGCSALAFLQPLPAADVGVDRNVDDAAVVALDPRTGEIRALVGNLAYWDAPDSATNLALDALRQPGTVLTPFIYLTALSQGYTAATMVLDVETEFGGEGVTYVPQNRDGRFHGPMRLRQALGNDYYVPAIQVAGWVGMDKVVRTAQNLGLTTLERAPGSYDLSLVLGGGAVTLTDLTYAYGVLANMGVMAGQPRPAEAAGDRGLDPVAVVRVADGTGSVLYDYYEQLPQQDILTPQLAYLMNDMLADRSVRCAAFGCPNVLELPDNRPAAVKAGSTNDFRDAWTIGYTPQLVTGVWVGNADNRGMDGVTGVQGAAPIWRAIMAWALHDAPVNQWSQPPGLVETAVCEISGLLATPICPTVSELFVQGTQPTVPDTIFRELAVDRETGRLATVYTPPDLVENRIYRVYPEAATDWAAANGVEAPPTEYDTIDTADGDSEEAAILSPAPFAFVSGTVPITGTASGDDFAFYRLAYFSGLNPANLQTIVAEARTPQQAAQLGAWDVSNLDVSNLSGLYTLLLTVVREDGSFSEAVVSVTVDNTPPTVSLSLPRPGQLFSAETEAITVRAQAADDAGLDRVEFYVEEADGEETAVLFATTTTAPHTVPWEPPGFGCYHFQAVAMDAAGNRGESTAVPVCIAAP